MSNSDNDIMARMFPHIGAHNAKRDAIAKQFLDAVTTQERELWSNDTDRVFVVGDKGIGIAAFHHVIVKTPEEWHKQSTYRDSMLNVCKLLRDSSAIMTDLPDDSDKAMAEAKLAEAIRIARQICKDLPA